MIARVWYGYTAPESADEYEAFVTEEVLPNAESGIAGCLGGEVLRRSLDGEVEFVTVIRFADYDAVESFAGEEYETAHVPERARALLSRWDEEVAHYEVV
ncbi:antibiotic biosynthesis monooxygenase [Salarchaeum sp. JOR-1]|uniref:antibiotic biosynthesis monooxygenase family protein n=1 Tax=Salarchaeum sp. JOR-1 TaxID=2599399 RepID=UPI001198372B|nr:antibiotic biosynthesis monooxygenase [Salarchaeum sp. JOR-1]QDX41373.1 antibiotic biosynthesis monooxygenase [Salarchaeum sp. JOR-1]